MKKIPKIQKNLKKHLTQESKDIMLRTAVGITTGVVLLGSYNGEVTAHTNSFYNVYPICPHISGIVNGHMSNTPVANPSVVSAHNNQHSNHCSWMC